jgi:hypothetical protein
MNCLSGASGLTLTKYMGKTDPILGCQYFFRVIVVRVRTISVTGRKDDLFRGKIQLDVMAGKEGQGQQHQTVMRSRTTECSW